MTRLLPTFLALMGMLLVACGGTSTTTNNTTGKASADKQVLVIPGAAISDIKTFDPGLSTDLPSIFAIDNVFTGLVQLNDKLQVVPQLAASYSMGSDGFTWTFKLKPNLKFSDGTPLTSQDVVYSIDRALQPATKSTVGPIYLALVKDSDKLPGRQDQDHHWRQPDGTRSQHRRHSHQQESILLPGRTELLVLLRG